MTIDSILEQLGLTRREVAVYLAALELGHASVQRIAQKASIKRPTAYVTLATLQEKGFVVSIPRGATTLYQAVDPEEIFRKFEEKIGAFKAALPEFKSLFNAAPGKPKVRFYEGKKNILALYADEIFHGGSVMSAFSPKEWIGVFGEKEMEDTLYLLKSNGITIRDLLEDSPQARDFASKKERLGLGDTKFLPKGFSLGVDILVYDNTVAMISLKNLMAVVIEDQLLSHAQKQFIDFLWEAIP